MIRGARRVHTIVAAAAAAGAAALLGAPTAVAEPEFEYADVPGMIQNVELSTKCHSWERFIFGRGAGGQTYACHYIPNQWPPVDSGFWVWSPPLYGVQEIGAPCPAGRQAAAQTPDGLPLECTESRGWQQDFYA